MTLPIPPDDIVELAEERSRARSERDWSTADELRARIEAAGWRVVDAGTDFELSPARPADIVEADRTLYGSVDSVPSRLSEPACERASIIVVTDHGSAAVAAATLARLREFAPADTQVLAVADGSVPTTAVTDADEVVWTPQPFAPAAALQAGLRRATGRTVVVLEPGRLPNGDVAAPIAAELDDHTVAIVGVEGLRSRDLRRFQLAPKGDVTALRPACYGFRRVDAIERGPLDERLHLPGSVSAWWSLVLRDEGEGATPRRALAVPLPLDAVSAEREFPGEHARLARRDAYRIADRFGRRPDLADGDP